MVAMLAFATLDNAQPLSGGLVVTLSSELASIQGPDGRLVPADTLGYGLVQQSTTDGYALVRWLGAGFECWVEQADLRSLGPEARLLTVEKYDGRGVCKQVRHKVASNAGLRHTWTAEIRQPNVVRVLRQDGLKWTFKHNKLFRSIDVWWPQPPEDDDAEALTVAELAIRV